MRLKWVKTLMCVTAALGLWSMEGHAADRGDQGPPSPDKTWQMGFSPSYSSGNFGTNTTSSFFYAPLSIRRLFKDGDVTLIIPFVTVTTDGRTTLVGGNPVRVENSGPGSNNNTSGCSNSGPGKRDCLTGRVQGQTATDSGLGDIILRGRYYIIDEKDYVPLIAVTARMKFPTANASLGLGTGAFDHGYGVEMSKMLGEKWIAYLDGGYNFIGDPNGLQLRNQYWYDVGAGRYLIKDFLVSLYYEEYRSLVPGIVNSRDVFFSFNYKASAAWRFNGGVAVGLSDNAPDYVVSLGTSYRF